MRAVEEAVEEAETKRWRRTDPEAQARAAGMVQQLVDGLHRLRADRDAASARGDERAVRQLEEQIETRQAWLEQAQASLTELGG
jgi:hypothetical protein